jgi:hypothetical protein
MTLQQVEPGIDRFGHFAGLTASHQLGDLPSRKMQNARGPGHSCMRALSARCQRGKETDGHSFVVDGCAIGSRRL